MESCDSECVSLSPDEGEAYWDALGRMSSVRRSSRFNRPRLISVTLRSGPDGYGIQLEGRSPPTIASLSQFTVAAASYTDLQHSFSLQMVMQRVTAFVLVINFWR